MPQRTEICKAPANFCVWNRPSAANRKCSLLEVREDGRALLKLDPINEPNTGDSVVLISPQVPF